MPPNPQQDINHSGDGGLYAELIRNRAFQGANTPDPFTAVGGAKLSLTAANPLSAALPKSLSVAGGSGAVGFANPGWWGIDVLTQPYAGSFYVRGDYAGKFTASLLSSGKEVLGSVEVLSKSTATGWTRHSFTIVPGKKAADVNNVFTITFDAAVG